MSEHLRLQRYSNIQPSFISFQVLHTLEHRELLLPLGKGSVAPFQNAHIQNLLLQSWTTQLKVWKLPQIGVGITKRYQFIAGIGENSSTHTLTKGVFESHCFMCKCKNSWFVYCLYILLKKTQVHIYIYRHTWCCLQKIDQMLVIMWNPSHHDLQAYSVVISTPCKDMTLHQDP